MKITRDFPCLPASVTEARRYVATLLGDVPRDLSDSIGVMVSELATNAVSHAASGFTIVVDVERDSVSVEVADTGPGRPSVRTPKPTDRSGRGLRIVDAFADSWGIEDRTADHGKAVWFRVRLPEGSRDSTG